MKLNHLLLILVVMTLVFPASPIQHPTQGDDIGNSDEKSLGSSPDRDLATNEYIVFFGDKQSVLDATTKLQVSRIYPHLLAIRVPYSSKLSTFTQATIVEARHYTTQQLHQNTIKNVRVDANSPVLDIPDHNGSGITIAILDNGIDFSHPLLQNKKVGSFFAGLPGKDPCFNHGTPVAGVAAAAANAEFSGVAPGALLYDIQFSCVGGSIDGDFLAAFDHLISLNDTIDVINTSFGGFAPTWDPVMAKVVESGIIVVGSSGNSGPSLHTTTTGGPGNSIHSISIGSVTANSELSLFSSRGPAYELTYKPDLLALGEDVVSTNDAGGLSAYSGTSFSSPAVTGGIAVLLSALKANNIEYNPGLVKAALMETATSIGERELEEGKGMVNITAAYELIRDRNNSGGLVSLHPQEEMIHSLGYVPQGMELNFPVTVVSSDPATVNVTLGSEIASVAEVSTISQAYSQQLIISLPTESFPPNTLISSSLTVEVDGRSSQFTFNITIGGSSRATLGIDRYHTYWDQFGANHIGGSNIGSMVELAMQHNLTVLEINEPLTDQVLADIDILWMPDPLNLMNAPPEPLEDQGFEEGELDQSEVDAIHEFVTNGNALFLTTLGYRFETVGIQSFSFGLNTTAFNTLTSRYGIEASQIPVSNQFTPDQMMTINQSSLVGSTKAISYSGNYLRLSGSAWILAATGNNIGVAYYQDSDTKGRVVVSSTNFWMDNLGIGGAYSASGDDKLFSSNLWDWIVESDHPVKLSHNVTDNQLMGSFSIPAGSTSLELYQHDSNSRSEVEYTLSNSIYSFSIPVEEEGRYTVTAELLIDERLDYIGWDYINDLSGPQWTIAGKNPNGTSIPAANFVILGFSVKDTISDLALDTFEMDLNGEDVDLVHTLNDGNLQVVIPDRELVDNATNQLDLTIEDVFGNPSTLQYYFNYNVSKEEPTSTSMSGSSTTGHAPFLGVWMALVPLLVRYISRRWKTVVAR